jgi:hypothetical protein
MSDQEPTVILIIKGGMTQAVDAATQRGVPIQLEPRIQRGHLQNAEGISASSDGLVQ